MTDKRIIVQVKDIKMVTSLEDSFQRGVKCIFYDANILSVKEIDLDSGEVVDKPVKEFKKIIFTPQKDFEKTGNFDYEIQK